MCLRRKAISFQIVANGMVVSRTAGYNKDQPESVSSDTVVAPSSRIMVWVETDSDNSNGMYDNGGTWCWNQFSGHILH